MFNTKSRAFEGSLVIKLRVILYLGKTGSGKKLSNGLKKALKSFLLPGVVAHPFNPSTLEAEVGEFLSSRPAWSTK
jgi:major histocompatibility complex class I